MTMELSIKYTGIEKSIEIIAEIS